MIGKLAAVAAVGAMIAGPALAGEASGAQLGAINGSVVMSQNGKMVAASATALKAGDRVVASANGSASLKFADGCIVAVKPSSMITVGAKSPCASGAGLVQATAANVQQDAAAAKKPFSWGDMWGTGWTPLDYGLLVVGIGGIAWAASDADPSSPHALPGQPVG